MQLSRSVRALMLCGVIAVWIYPALAGVSRPIQDKYRRNYENKALFLKIPVFSERELVLISGKRVRTDEAPRTGTARLKVGDQARVTGIDFGSDEIRFKLSGINNNAIAEVIFKFDSNLLENFPNSDVFESALQATFTEGLKYTDLEEAKRGYVEDEFDRIIRDIATTAGTNRETVLKTIAPRVPAYQEATHEIESLRNRTQDLSAQISQAQAENRKTESELRAQQAEVARLRNLTSSLQEKIDSSTSQLSRLGDDLRTARGVNQGYQKELANLQRSFNLKVDAGRDLASQIADLGQVMHRVQKENETLEGQNTSLRTDLDALQSLRGRLMGEIEDLKGSNQKMRDTIGTLTSKEDSLARQYIELKQIKENLEDFALSAGNLRTALQEEKTEGGTHFGKTNLYLRNILLGSMEWRLPEHLSPNEDKPAEAHFSTESIDYVRVQPDERHILRSFGDRLKMQVSLSSGSDSMEVKPEKENATQEIGERDRASWHWRIRNRGTQDSSLRLQASLVNKNSAEIPVVQQESIVFSASMVRQVRNYLQPIPLVVGALLGALLLGIVGVFRRARHSRIPPVRQPVQPTEPGSYARHKQL